MGECATWGTLTSPIFWVREKEIFFCIRLGSRDSKSDLLSQRVRFFDPIPQLAHFSNFYRAIKNLSLPTASSLVIDYLHK